MMDITKTGDFIAVFEWNAKVLDVFRSDSGRFGLELWFAKDVARGKPKELHVVDPEAVTPSNREAFVKEIKDFLKSRIARMNSL